MTSFSLFIHNFDIDDYADLSKAGRQEKFEHLFDERQDLEKIVLNGTFFCPFLGSAVQELPDCITKVFQVCSTDDIFISTKQKQKTSARTGL
ncbi:hypothetical protein CU097_004362 [Rhizopus azygosporus]|uniref:Uncharacterized protein n=1 Tax=Rhizopus azygosporus TaxID=86630 RepID=A0A367IRQ9_RHIAZ|nr:hypothetical protein CU097_004362 [Rhizopus azygosporus]